MKKRPLQITAQANGRRADIRIEGEIAFFKDANAKAFGDSIARLEAQGIQDAHVFIDSEGGNVLEAKRIVQAMRRLKGVITVEGGAMVASAATYIAVKADAFRLRPDTAVMLHKPVVGLEGNEDALETSLKFLKDVTQDYREAYVAKTGKTSEEVDAMWAKGERWLTGTEAVAEGLADGLVEEDDEEDEDGVDQDVLARIAACGCPENKLPKARAAINNDEMDIKAMRALLGMPEGATEAEVVARVNELKQANEQHAAAAVAQRKANVKAILDKAVAERKLTEAHRASFEAKFAAAYDATKAEVEALMPAPELAKETAGAKKEVQAAGRDAWTYDQWATADLKGLQAMMKKNPDEFQRLYQAKYGKKAKLTA
ncbi:MAG: ATP-dependent Clp protease proteolytic subunit [Bacteroidetes bacterium]|nr:ATP-dependent Clp protease proteolytic subunit [Bacteroidota bacterium]